MFRSKYRNLVIIGNGFDRWQHLPTSYDEFRKYYADHIDEAMDALGISPKTVVEPDGTTRTITPVELIYGDPFNPKKLPSEFFWSFETSLDKMAGIFAWNRSKAWIFRASGRNPLRPRTRRVLGWRSYSKAAQRPVAYLVPNP